MFVARVWNGGTDETENLVIYGADDLHDANRLADKYVSFRNGHPANDCSLIDVRSQNHCQETNSDCILVKKVETDPQRDRRARLVGIDIYDLLDRVGL